MFSYNWYQLSTNYNNLKETQHVLSFEIPVVGQYKYNFNSQWGLIASAGAKISIPAFTAYKTIDGDITTTGYYSQWNLVLYDLPQHGLLTTNDTYTGKLSLKTAVMAIAEVGGTYKLSKQLDLYAGAYFNYGINNIIKADTKSIYQFDGTYNGIFASNEVASIKPISVGIKVGVYWNFMDKQSNPEAIDAKKILPVKVAVKKPAIKQDKVILPVEPKDSVKAISTISPVINQPEIIKTEVAKPVIISADSAKKIDVVKVVDTVATVTQPTVEFAKPVVIAQEESKKSQSVDSIKTVDVLEKAIEISNLITLKLAESSNSQVTENQSKMAAEVDAMAKELSDILKANSDITLRITGHTDKSGSSEECIKSGVKRALAVSNYFRKNKVSSVQLLVKSKGFYQPIVPNTTPENRKKNNRVEISTFRAIKK